MKHALVKVDGMLIPLIGIPPDATKEACDKCHKLLPLWEITFTGKQYLCEKHKPKDK